ncbi:uncharacterized protein K441DRAFT_661631 [Cenococcum geophilum 1.58]|uniref:uncharacterized protein n=1 Tax=Cenococcum geophilum 1.58 TaxID=794803 RepID=UPI00358F5E41|nr:hypothetical protein K441DRAFT_661631 [Cenococcum geophilum 1.58]
MQSPGLLQLTVAPGWHLYWLTVTSKKRIGGELCGQIRQLCIVVGTSGSMSLEDLVNDFILTASVLSLLTYLI